MKKISICIPVYNEEKYVILLLQKLLAVDFSAHGYACEIIIVNDGSTDTSESLILDFIKTQPGGLFHYSKQKNQGKGAAIKTAFAQATGDIMVIQDADLEYEPNDLLAGIHCIEQGNSIAYGSRVRGFATYGFTYSTVPFLVGGLTVSLVSSILSMKLLTDEPTCYKMFHKDCKPWLLLPKENGFEREPAITMLLLRKGFTYAEWPIRYYPRKVTAGKKIKLKDGFKALWTLVKWRWKKI